MKIMEFKFEELKDKNIKYFEINLEKSCFKNFKNIFNENREDKSINLKLDFNTLNLGQKLYGNSKIESKNIQKNNCNLVLKVFSICKKIISFLLKNNIEFNGVFFIENLSQKKNNNDYLIISLLNLKFNDKKNKMNSIITYSCDFLNMENNINNMCDFRDNKCVSCRERNIDRIIGCCQKNCKFAHAGVCNVKNISCKLYMCDYLENKGYYFSPYYHPILKKHLSLVQRFVCTFMLFKSLDFQVKTLKFSKFIPFIFTLIIFLLIIVRFI